MFAAKHAVPEHSRQHLYSVRDLVTTLNLSRRTLLYYEKLGIVTPERDEDTGYRWYTPNDIFRLMSGILLKNIGIPPKDLGARLNDGPFSSERFAEYSEAIERRIAYCQAQLECMEGLGELVDKVGTIEERRVEAYCISYDRAETGYHDFPDDEGLVSLLQNLPIGGLGNRYSGDLFDPATTCCWGRTVALRFAHLIPDLPVERLETMGGCRCVCSVTYNEDIFADSGPDEAERIRAYLDEHRLRTAGRPFAPYSLPSDHGFYVLLCVPAEPVDGAEGTGQTGGPQKC